MKDINLQDPLQGRRWLQLILPDDRCGYRLRPVVSASARELGFSCTTNRLGLRGPCDERAANVVFGTSYAMGVAVDDGQNWHDLALPASGWLNLGLAVGIREWRELTEIHHRGPKNCAVLMYHPNIWAHCLMYERWRASGRELFPSLGWRSDLLGCAGLSLKRWAKRPGKRRRGEIIEFDRNGRHYVIDPLYARIFPAEHRELIDRNLKLLLALLKPFQEVWCVRLPVKQELVPPGHRNQLLEDTVASYNDLWRETSHALSTLPGAHSVELRDFVLEDYHPADSHWAASGNARFASWIKSTVLSGRYHPRAPKFPIRSASLSE